MKEITIEAVKATFLSLDPNKKQHNFELLGMDFMIDQDLKPWLIEINTNPCLELSCPLLSKLIPGIIENTLRYQPFYLEYVWIPFFLLPKNGLLPKKCKQEIVLWTKIILNLFLTSLWIESQSFLFLVETLGQTRPKWEKLMKTTRHSKMRGLNFGKKSYEYVFDSLSILILIKGLQIIYARLSLKC